MYWYFFTNHNVYYIGFSRLSIFIEHYSYGTFLHVINAQNGLL